VGDNSTRLPGKVTRDFSQGEMRRQTRKTAADGQSVRRRLATARVERPDPGVKTDAGLVTS
jgi:hypothetical protein